MKLITVEKHSSVRIRHAMIASAADRSSVLGRVFCVILIALAACTTTTEVPGTTGVLFGMSSLMRGDGFMLNAEQVTVTLEGRNLTTHPDANGYWSFRLPRGIYTVRITAPYTRPQLATNVEFIGKDSFQCWTGPQLTRYRFGRIRVDTSYVLAGDSGYTKTLRIKVNAQDTEAGVGRYSARIAFGLDSVSVMQPAFGSGVEVPLDSVFSYTVHEQFPVKYFWSVWLMDGEAPVFDTSTGANFDWQTSWAHTPARSISLR